MNANRRLRLSMVAVVILFATSGYAQEIATQAVNNQPVAPGTYGVASLSTYVINAWNFEFITTGSGTTSFHTPGGRYFTSPGQLRAGVNLPNGAVIQAIEIQGCDTSATGAIGIDLSSYVTQAGNAFQVIHGNMISGATVASTDGCQTWSTPVNVIVDNSQRSYYVTLSAGTSSPANSIHAVRLYYRLQVSPAPGTATFGDVPVGSPFHRFVEAMVAAGITGGCGGGNYCPDQPVTRAQMAVFFAVSLGLHWPN